MRYIVYHPRGFKNEVVVSAHDRYSEYLVELDRLSHDRTVTFVTDADMQAQYIQKMHREWAKGRGETEMIFTESDVTESDVRMNTLNELIALGESMNNIKLTTEQAYRSLLNIINERLAEFDFSAIDRTYIFKIESWKERDYLQRELRWELTLGKKSCLELTVAKYIDSVGDWTSASLESPSIERIHTATAKLSKAFEYFFGQLRLEKQADDINHDTISKLITSLT